MRNFFLFLLHGCHGNTDILDFVYKNCYVSNSILSYISAPNDLKFGKYVKILKTFIKGGIFEILIIFFTQFSGIVHFSGFSPHKENSPVLASASL